MKTAKLQLRKFEQCQRCAVDSRSLHDLIGQCISECVYQLLCYSFVQLKAWISAVCVRTSEYNLWLVYLVDERGRLLSSLAHEKYMYPFNKWCLQVFQPAEGSSTYSVPTIQSVIPSRVIRRVPGVCLWSFVSWSSTYVGGWLCLLSGCLGLPSHGLFGYLLLACSFLYLDSNWTFFQAVGLILAFFYVTGVLVPS